MTAHGLGRDDLIGALQDAVNDDIVADATKDYRPTISEKAAGK